MNKQRLQQLAGITQLNEITIQPNTKLFSWVSNEEICYDEEDLITYFDKEDEDDTISFSSELTDIGYDEMNILESIESLEQTMSYLEDNGYEDASSTVSQYITFRNELEKFKIPYIEDYFGDGGTVYIDLQLKYNDIKSYIK